MALSSLEFKKSVFVVSPYIAVALGLYLFENAFLSLLLYHVGMIIPIVLYRKNIEWKKLILFNRKWLAIIVVGICFISGIVISSFWETVKIPSLDLLEKMTQYKLIGVSKILFLIYFSTVHPILEELYWRFVITPRSKLITLYELLFAGYHMLVVRLFVQAEYVIVTFVGLIIMARFWRFLRENLSENFLVFLSHLIADFSIMYFIFRLY